MSDRPDLTKGLDSAIFESYYYLKEELVQFCKEEGLQTTGGKADLTKRISHYLATGEKLVSKVKSKAAAQIKNIAEDTVIEKNFVCTEKHRAFFKEKIGGGFSFNVTFQNWIKQNAGRTYEDAVTAYHQIVADMKTGKTVISKQFEYNTYIRAFFEDSKGRTLQDAIQCWKHKKSLPGHNRYEKEDLAALLSDSENPDLKA